MHHPKAEPHHHHPPPAPTPSSQAGGGGGGGGGNSFRFPWPNFPVFTVPVVLLYAGGEQEDAHEAGDPRGNRRAAPSAEDPGPRAPGEAAPSTTMITFPTTTTAASAAQSAALMMGWCFFDPLMMQRENQSLRNQTGSLLATWEDLETTVTALMEAEEEALAANSSTNSSTTSSSSTGSSSTGPSIADLLADGDSREAGAAEEQAVYDPSWMFWDTGLSSAGVQGLITSDAALALALNKARSTACVVLCPSLTCPEGKVKVSFR